MTLSALTATKTEINHPPGAAMAKSKPGALTFGSAGNGSTSHLSGALFESMAGVDMLHIPYKGSAPLLNDLLGGLVDTTFDSLTVYEAHIKSGKVKALAVTSSTRMTALPDVPTLSESGLAGYDVSNWLGVLAPAGTPRDIIMRLNAALTRANADPASRLQLQSQGIEPTSSTPEELEFLKQPPHAPSRCEQVAGKKFRQGHGQGLLSESRMDVRPAGINRPTCGTTTANGQDLRPFSDFSPTPRCRKYRKTRKQGFSCIWPSPIRTKLRQHCEVVLQQSLGSCDETQPQTAAGFCHGL